MAEVFNKVKKTRPKNLRTILMRMPNRGAPTFSSLKDAFMPFMHRHVRKFVLA